MTDIREALVHLISALGERPKHLNDDELWGAYTHGVAALASCDTRPEGGDAVAAPFTGGAVAAAKPTTDAQKEPQ